MNARYLIRYRSPRLAMLLLCAGAAPALSAAPPAPPPKAPPAPAPARPAPAAAQYGTGTLSLANGNYQFSPQGCTHNGNRAICNFFVTYSGAQQGSVNAWGSYYGQWTMQVQLVDNLHVPHQPDTSYFIDATGAHQPTLFIQQGLQVWVTIEYANVDASVTAGEFHMGNQIVGGIAIGQLNAQASPAPSSGAPPAVAPQPPPGVAVLQPVAQQPVAQPPAAQQPVQHPECDTPGNASYSTFFCKAYRYKEQVNNTMQLSR
jgi:hypothetical protein